MDILGGASSVATILDLAWKIKTLRDAVRDAPRDWQRYCDGVQTVATIVDVIKSLCKNSLPTDGISIAIEGREKPEPLVEHLNTVLSTAIDDANALLIRHKRPTRFSSLQKIFGRIKFVLDKREIDVYIERIEATRKTLHMTLTMVAVQATYSISLLQQDAGNILRQLQGHMAQLLDCQRTLSSGPPLSQATMRVDFQDSWCQGIVRARSSGAKLLSGKTPFRRDKRKQPSSPTQSPSSQGAGQEVERSDNRPHDNSDCESDEGLAGPNMTSTARGWELLPTKHDPEYGIVGIGNQYLQVPTDSDIYKFAAGPGDPHGSPACAPVTSITGIRVDEILDSLSESDWEEAEFLPVENLMGFLTSARPSAYATDVEMSLEDESSPPITINCSRESYVLVPCEANLSLCQLRFCIDRVSVTETTQGFWAIGPCADQRSPRCQHITMEIEEGAVFEEGPPTYRLKLSCFVIGEQLGSEQNNNSVLSFASTCRGRSRRNDKSSNCLRHTVFDKDGHTACALPVALFASPVIPSNVSDASIERAPSEADGDDATDDPEYQGEDKAGEEDWFPNTPRPGDDESTFELLRMIAFVDTYEPPQLSELGELIRFLSLIDKYRRYMNQRPLNQARIWAASLIQNPEDPDEDDTALLWVMWKLGMGEEFKKLSAAIQQHAHSSISQWQKGPRNKHGIKLPKCILERLDQRRVEALSTIRDKIAEELEKQRQVFDNSVRAAHSGEGVFFPWPTADMVRSSITFGYLQLESDRWIKPREPDQDVNDPDFLGYSFVDILNSVSGMLELGDWKVSTVPIADRMPIFVGMLLTVVPIVGAGLHTEGLHVRLDGDVKAELLRVVRQAGDGNWGVDLNEIGE